MLYYCILLLAIYAGMSSKDEPSHLMASSDQDASIAYKYEIKNNLRNVN